MIKTFTRLTALLCGVLLVIASGAAYSQAGSGYLRSFVYATASDLVIAQPADFEPIPQMSVDVAAAQPVLVRFCGAVNMIDGGSGGSMSVAPLLDGAVSGASIQFTAETIRLPHCWTWVLEDFAAGAHTVGVAWTTTGDQVVIQDRTLTVEGLLRSLQQ